jgi:hypothetical protein
MPEGNWSDFFSGAADFTTRVGPGISLVVIGAIVAWKLLDYLARRRDQ